MTRFLTLFFCLLVHTPTAVLAQSENRLARTIVTSDGEIDDVDSFIRMLLMANEFKLEGLVYSSSQWHYKGDGKGTPFTSELDMSRRIYGERTELRWVGTKWMQELIKEYKKVYPSLKTHAEGFPTPKYLRSIIHVGNIDFEGEMEKVTKGSEFIKEKLLDDSREPIYLQAWGGTNTIARALKSIEEEYQRTADWNRIYKKVSDKAILYIILDQDATYRNYIAKAWPEVRVLFNGNQFWSVAYFWKRQVPEGWQHYLNGDFMSRHILHDHGPLTEKYYTWGDGQQQEGDPEHTHGLELEHEQWGTFEKYDFISEGDSPAYFHLVDVGLDNLSHPEYGGWGGRLNPSDSIPRRWDDGKDVTDFNPFTRQPDMAYPQTRWIPALQLEFAARADWCVKSYEEANHPPEVTLDHAAALEVSPGETIHLQAVATDPDGDSLAYDWWQYGEVDTYNGDVDIIRAYMPNPMVQIPADLQAGETIHIIVSVTDGQFPNLTRYQRVILTGK